MPHIRPVSDLRNNFAEISRIVHETGEPVFLTKNGYGDMVVSDVVYDQLMKLYKSDYPETDWCEIADKYPELYDWLDSHITNIDDGYSFNYKLKFIE